MDSRLRRSPPDRASAVPYGQAGENAMRFPHLAHRSAAAHKLHSTPRQHRMMLISGNDQTSSRLPAFSLFQPGSCPNNRDRRRKPKFAVDSPLEEAVYCELVSDTVSRFSKGFWAILVSLVGRNLPNRGPGGYPAPE